MAKVYSNNKEMGYESFSDCTRSEAIKLLKARSLYLDKNQHVQGQHLPHAEYGLCIYRGKYSTKARMLFIWHE